MFVYWTTLTCIATLVYLSIDDHCIIENVTNCRSYAQSLRVIVYE